jgi:dihydrolipoamide dehydrogenase
MPSKALLRPEEALDEARRIPGAAEAATGELDVEAVLKRRDEVIHDLDDSGMVPWLDDKGIAVFRGAGKLDGERRVVVGDDVLNARRAVVVAAGSGSRVPPIEGLEAAGPWSNREITTAKHVPERLIALGGGVVGVEMAQAWTTLGSKVTLLEAGERILAREEPFASEQVADALRALGVDIRTGAKATKVTRDESGVTVGLEGGDTVEGDELLVAIGRYPHTKDLGLESVGLEPGKPIEVEDSMQASGKDWLYAIGDVNGRVLLTHMGKYQGRIAADRVCGENAAVLSDGALSPRVIFTEPQVAAVGHTVASAREAGLDVRTVEAGTSANAGGSFYGRDAPGTTQLVIDDGRGVIAGATFTGVDVADFLHAATIAVVGEVPLERIAHAVPSFPTRSEVWLNLLEAAGL